MFCENIFSVIVVLFWSISNQSMVTGRLPYTTSLNGCPNTDEPIFLTDNTTCTVFRNQCYMLKYYERFYMIFPNQKPNVFFTTKAVCQTQCNRDCQKYFYPVCGSPNDSSEFVFYAHECELMIKACQLGKGIIRQPYHKCYSVEN